MIKVRNEKGEYPCYLCEYACNSKRGLCLHTTQAHSDTDSSVCNYCSYRFKDVSSVRRHIKTVHINVKEYLCTYCNKLYKHKYDLELHFKKIHNEQRTEEYSYCSECKALCFGLEQLKQHFLDAHGKNIQHIKCPDCMKIFFDVVYLKQHFKRVHGNRTLTVIFCHDCGSVFEDQVQLVEHMQSKHFWNTDTIQYCTEEKCSEIFEDSCELEKHVKEEHEQDKKLRVSDTVFECSECTSGFSTKLELVAHMTEHHQWSSVLECQKCNRLFGSSDDVKEHFTNCGVASIESNFDSHSILKKKRRKSSKSVPKLIIRLDEELKTAPQEEVVENSAAYPLERPESSQRKGLKRKMVNVAQFPEFSTDAPKT